MHLTNRENFKTRVKVEFDMIANRTVFNSQLVSRACNVNHKHY